MSLIDDLLATMLDGTGQRKVVLVGYFPFIPRLHERVGNLSVLGQGPLGNELSAEAAIERCPQGW